MVLSVQASIAEFRQSIAENGRRETAFNNLAGALAQNGDQAGAIEADTFRTFEVYITIAVLYLVLVTVISQALLWLPAPQPGVAGARDG